MEIQSVLVCMFHVRTTGTNFDEIWY